MKTEFTDLTETHRSITIEVPTDIVDAEIDRVARDYTKSARIPGFRPRQSAAHARQTALPRPDPPRSQSDAMASGRYRTKKAVNATIASAGGARQASAAAMARDTSDALPAIKPDAARSRAPGRVSAARQIAPTHIAGEIPVPQVLFITARDQRRFADFHHRRYLHSSRELADATPTPSWMTVTGSARRETAP